MKKLTKKQFEAKLNDVYCCDCLEAMKWIPDNSISSVVTDPPYGLSFMGKDWDKGVPGVAYWKEALRILKPGGHLLSFAGSRTYHRMACAIEDAGFEIRDQIMWVYGSGFPKSYNIAKGLNKYLKTGNASWNGTGDSSSGALGYAKLQHKQGYRPNDYSNKHQNKDEITESKAKKWEGWGTALKPAHEPIVVARKPLDGTVAENCLKWGVGGLNIDGCRVGYNDGTTEEQILKKYTGSNRGKESPTNHFGVKDIKSTNTKSTLQGRFPANFIHDGSDEVVDLFPTKGEKSEARFFYCAKASKKERNMGCEGLPLGEAPASARSKPAEGRENALGNPRQNHHPTVKPIALMRYLCRLVTPKGGLVLDPFMGSGTTAMACVYENFNFIGFDLSEEYIKIAKVRIEAAKKDNKQTSQG